MPGTTTPATTFGLKTAPATGVGWAGLVKPSTRSLSPGLSKSASISPSRQAPNISLCPSATPRPLLTGGRELELWPSAADEDDLIPADTAEQPESGHAAASQQRHGRIPPRTGVTTGDMMADKEDVVCATRCYGHEEL